MLLPAHESKVIHTLAILLIFTHVGVGGGGVSGLGEISSSGATSGLSANILSKSICLEKNKCPMILAWSQAWRNIQLNYIEQCIYDWEWKAALEIGLPNANITIQESTVPLRLNKSWLMIHLFSFCVSIFYPLHCDTLIVIIQWGDHCLVYSSCESIRNRKKQTVSELCRQWKKQKQNPVLLSSYYTGENIKMRDESWLLTGGEEFRDHEESRPGRHL